MAVFEFNDENYLREYFKFRKSADYFWWVRRLPIRGNVLEVGSGPGQLSEELTDCKYTGFDIAPGSIRLAKKLYPSKKFVCGDAHALTSYFEKDGFDWVITVDVLEHADNPMKIVEQMVRVARPGGKILIKAPNQPNMYFFLKSGKNPFRWRDYVMTKPDKFKWGSESDHKWMTSGIAFRNELLKLGCEIHVYDDWFLPVHRTRLIKDVLLKASKYVFKPIFPHLGYNFIIIAQKPLKG
ncbi:MAG: class I SAM-dependent methyltransferase [Candidatus Aenigmatarchaeota archaeon]